MKIKAKRADVAYRTARIGLAYRSGRLGQLPRALVNQFYGRTGFRLDPVTGQRERLGGFAPPLWSDDITPALKPDLYWIPLDSLVSVVGFSPGEGGWHPFKAALQADCDGGDGLEVLYSYYRKFSPVSMQDCFLNTQGLVSHHMSHLAAHPKLLGFAWLINYERALKYFRVSHSAVKSLHYGPKSGEEVARKLAKVRRIFNSMVSDGYSPQQYEDGPISGYFAVSSWGYRFVVLSGNHRLGALGILKPMRVLVRMHPAMPASVDVATASMRIRVGEDQEAQTISAILTDSLTSSTGRTGAERLGLA